MLTPKVTPTARHHATPHRHGAPHVGPCPGCQQLRKQQAAAHMAASAAAAAQWAATPYGIARPLRRGGARMGARTNYGAAGTGA